MPEHDLLHTEDAIQKRPEQKLIARRKDPVTRQVIAAKDQAPGILTCRDIRQICDLVTTRWKRKRGLIKDAYGNSDDRKRNIAPFMRFNRCPKGPNFFACQDNILRSLQNIKETYIK